MNRWLCPCSQRLSPGTINEVGIVTPRVVVTAMLRLGQIGETCSPQGSPPNPHLPNLKTLVALDTLKILWRG